MEWEYGLHLYHIRIHFDLPWNEWFVMDIPTSIAEEWKFSSLTTDISTSWFHKLANCRFSVSFTKWISYKRNSEIMWAFFLTTSFPNISCFFMKCLIFRYLLRRKRIYSSSQKKKEVHRKQVSNAIDRPFGMRHFTRYSKNKSVISFTLIHVNWYKLFVCLSSGLVCHCLSIDSECDCDGRETSSICRYCRCWWGSRWNYYYPFIFSFLNSFFCNIALQIIGLIICFSLRFFSSRRRRFSLLLMLKLLLIEMSIDSRKYLILLNSSNYHAGIFFYFIFSSLSFFHWNVHNKCETELLFSFSKMGAEFEYVHVRNTQFSAFIDKFTATTFVMVRRGREGGGLHCRKMVIRPLHFHVPGFKVPPFTCGYSSHNQTIIRSW